MDAAPTVSQPELLHFSFLDMEVVLNLLACHRYPWLAPFVLTRGHLGSNPEPCSCTVSPWRHSLCLHTNAAAKFMWPGSLVLIKGWGIKWDCFPPSMWSRTAGSLSRFVKLGIWIRDIFHSPPQTFGSEIDMVLPKKRHLLAFGRSIWPFLFCLFETQTIDTRESI